MQKQNTKLGKPTQAQGYIGRMYEEGWGVQEDKKEAGRWFKAVLEIHRKKAQQGDAAAQETVGELYWSDGTLAYNTKQPGYFGTEEEDYKECAKWFRKAADQGSIGAMHWLSGLYASHHAGEPAVGELSDDGNAYFWGLLSGDVAKGGAYSNGQQLSPETRAYIERLARDWKPVVGPAPVAAPPGEGLLVPP